MPQGQHQVGCWQRSCIPSPQQHPTAPLHLVPRPALILDPWSASPSGSQASQAEIRVWEQLQSPPPPPEPLLCHGSRQQDLLQQPAGGGGGGRCSSPADALASWCAVQLSADTETGQRRWGCKAKLLSTHSPEESPRGEVQEVQFPSQQHHEITAEDSAPQTQLCRLLPPQPRPPFLLRQVEAGGRGRLGEIGCWERLPLFVAKIKAKQK